MKLNMSEHELSQQLGKTAIFSGLSPEELSQLQMYFQHFVCPTGTRIISQATSHSGLHIILSGSVKVQLKVFGGSELELAVLKTFDSFGEISLISSYTATASVIAAEEVAVLLLTPTSMQTISIIYPQLSYKLKQAIALRCCQRIRTLLQYIPMKSYHQQSWRENNYQKRTLTKRANQFNVHTFSEFLKESSLELLFSNAFSKEELNILNECAKLSILHRGDTIADRNNDNPRVFWLLWGAIQAVLPGEHIVKVGTYGPGKLFSTVEYVDRLERPYHYVAREDAVYFSLNTEDMAIIKSASPELWNKISSFIWISVGAQMTNINWIFLQLNVEDVYSISRESNHV